MKYCIFVLVLFATALFAKAVANEEESTPLHRGTVVLVHGFMSPSMSMSPLAYTLRGEGWNVINWGYPSRDKWIEEHAEDLVVQLQRISARFPGRPIHFVTHSMGGLIVRCAVNHPACPEEAKKGRAVLVAPPYRGSSFARYLYKYPLVRWIVGEKAGRQLMKTPLDGFDGMGEFPAGMSVLVISGTMGWNPAISGPNDGKVGVGETWLSTPHNRERCFAGHSWITYCPAVIKKARWFLSTEETSKKPDKLP